VPGQSRETRSSLRRLTDWSHVQVATALSHAVRQDPIPLFSSRLKQVAEHFLWARAHLRDKEIWLLSDSSCTLYT
jgi:hypothetical protein